MQIGIFVAKLFRRLIYWLANFNGLLTSWLKFAHWYIRIPKPLNKSLTEHHFLELITKESCYSIVIFNYPTYLSIYSSMIRPFSS